MVSIGVVALLTGLLVPALSGVRASGRQAVCQANLRQMAVAALHYATLNDAYPIAVRYEFANGRVRQHAWDWVTTFDGQLLGPGALWTHTDHPDRVLQCPDYHGPANSPGDPHTGYNYNTTFIGGEGSLFGGVMRPGVRPHACRRTTTCAVFGCGGWHGGANKFMRAPVTTHGASAATIFAGGQAFRHRGTTNVSWLDGHVGVVEDPREGLDATPSLLRDWLDYPNNGFLSDDDSAYDPR
jgi:prepilin-type processing-associated H-X9-DG protein